MSPSVRAFNTLNGQRTLMYPEKIPQGKVAQLRVLSVKQVSKRCPS